MKRRLVFLLVIIIAADVYADPGAECGSIEVEANYETSCDFVYVHYTTSKLVVLIVTRMRWRMSVQMTYLCCNLPKMFSMAFINRTMPMSHFIRSTRHQMEMRHWKHRCAQAYLLYRAWALDVVEYWKRYVNKTRYKYYPSNHHKSIGKHVSRNLSATFWTMCSVELRTHLIIRHNLFKPIFYFYTKMITNKIRDIYQ